MRKLDYKEVVILSAELINNSKQENTINTNKLHKWIINENFPYKRTKGYNKNTSESSFLVVIKNKDDLDKLKNIAFTLFSQESILYQNNRGECFLMCEGKKDRYMGRLKEVPKTIISKYDYYTELDDKYFTTIK